MDLTVEQIKYLEERRREIQRDLEQLGSPSRGPAYHDVNERRIDLSDELERVEAELERTRAD